MKITIYEPKPEEKKEKELCLRLRQYGKVVSVWAVDEEDGSFRSLLLTIDSEGFLRARHVSPDIGLPLDGEGRVKVIGP